MRESDPRVNSDSDSGNVLRDNGGLGRACNTPVQSGHKPQIKGNVQSCGNSEKSQGNNGISQGTQQRSKKVIEKNTDQSGKDDDQIILHHSHQLFRCAEKPDDPVNTCKHKNIKNDGNNPEKSEGGQNSFFQCGIIFLAETDRKDCSASHCKSQQDGGQERHQREGGSDSRKGVFAEKTSHNQCIRDIVALLEKIPQDHGDSKAQHCFHNRSLSQLIFHFIHQFFLNVIFFLTYVIYNNILETECQSWAA